MKRSLATAMILLATVLSVGLPANGDETPAPDGGPWLGVYLIDEVDGGIRIVAVVPGGPAAIAGLRSGDLLLEAGEIALADQAALERVLVRGSPGLPLSFQVLREGQPLSVAVTPSLRRAVAAAVPAPLTPPTEPSPTPAAWPRLPGRLGLDVVPITPELRRHYGAEGDRGVLVVRAEEGALGRRAGVEVGDVVVGVEGQVVTRPAELELGVLRWSRREPLTLNVVREGEPLAVELAATERSASPFPRGRSWFAPDPEARRRMLETSIERLERQLAALKSQLAELDASEPSPEP